ncbi:MAG TPA: ABC transporter substrate-binding protein [Solirubrobacterales bacterium]|nr:ABC transporter substrate-binding protein [Solirubrobacterales bacterium]
MALTVVAAIVVAGCGSSSDDGGSDSGGSALEAGSTFKVGYAASQTGRLAIFEQPFIKGLEMSVDKINSEGGIDGKTKIELTVKDAKSDPSTGAVVAQELISEGAQFLITACDADASLPASQMAQQSEIPVLNSCGSGSGLPAQVGDFQFMNVYGTEVEGQGMAEFAIDQGYKNAYIMTSHDIEYTESMMEAAAETYEERGGNVLGTEQFNLDQPRYTTQATAIAGADPEVVITSIFLPASVTFMKNLRAAGYDGPVIGDDGQEGSETFSAGPAAENLFVFTFGFPSDDPAGQALAEWNAEYEQKYGEESGTVIGALGGTAACLIDAAVTAANSTDPVKVRDGMANLVDTPCPTSKITYKGQEGIPKADVVVLETNVAKKQFEFVKRFIPKTVTGG